MTNGKRRDILSHIYKVSTWLWLIGFIVTALLRYLYWQVGRPVWLNAIGGISGGLMFLSISSAITFGAICYYPKSQKFYLAMFFGLVTLVMGIILLFQSFGKLLPELRFIQ